MYSVGSLFYAIYFFVSFPAFFAMDEQRQARWTLVGAARDALASGMLVTILLDLWRLTLGPLEAGKPAGGVEILGLRLWPRGSKLPWM